MISANKIASEHLKLHIQPNHDYLFIQFCSYSNWLNFVLIAPMSIFKFQLPSKLLSIARLSTTIYIGTSASEVYKLEPPYLGPSLFLTLPDPVSSIEPLNSSTLIIGTWSGSIFQNGCHAKKVGRQIVKSIKVFAGHILVSEDVFVHILTLDFVCLRKIDLQCKILCFCIFKGELYSGTNKPLLVKFSENKITEPIFIESEHQTSILDICVNSGLLTCSADKTIRRNGRVIYQGNSWIYSVTPNAYGDGSSLYVDNIKVFEHKDLISRIIEFDGKIVSIGLDGQIVIVGENLGCTDEEEEEFRKMLENN